MKIYFIRHGHATHNDAYDKLQKKDVYRSFEYKDSHLTEKGKQQIKSVSLPFNFDRIYSSPLTRCIQTARILVGDKTTLYLHDGLLETQGPYPCNWRANIDTFMRSLDNYNLMNVSYTYEPYIDYYFPNVSETQEQVYKRAIKTLEYIKNECSSMSHVLVVTHNDWLESLFKQPFDNGEVYMVDYK